MGRDSTRMLTYGSGTKRTSRSRSATPVRTGKFARSQLRATVSAIPRTIRYNGINKLTRNCQVSLNYHYDAATLRGYVITDYPDTRFDSFGIIFGTKFVSIADTVNEQPFPIIGASELTNLYDLIKLDKVEIEFSTNMQSALPNLGEGDNRSSNPILLISNDDTDVGSNNKEAMLQESDCRYLRFGNQDVWKHTVYPKFQSVVYQTSDTRGYLPKTGFIRSSDDVPMYGTKVCVLNSDTSVDGGTAPHKLFMRFKMFYTCKNVR